MSKRVRSSIGLNSRQFETELWHERLEAARRFLPRSAMLSAFGILIFALLDLAVDPAHFWQAFRWRLLGASILVLMAVLTRLRMPRHGFELLLLIPPVTLVWTIVLAASELHSAILLYSGSLAIMLSLSAAWCARKRSFLTFNAVNLLALWYLVHRLDAPNTPIILVNCLLGSLCGALYFDFLYRLSRRNLRLRLELKEESRTDPLTGLPNRRAFYERGEDLALRAKRKKQPLAVCLIDADHFKRVNDQFGHDTGDAVLQSLASAIANSLGDPSVCGRLGGEEFGAVLQVQSEQELERITRSLVLDIAAHGWAQEGLPEMTASVGACFAEHAEEFSALMRVADENLYRAKNAGRNRANVSALSNTPLSATQRQQT